MLGKRVKYIGGRFPDLASSEGVVVFEFSEVEFPEAAYRFQVEYDGWRVEACREDELAVIDTASA